MGEGVVRQIKWSIPIFLKFEINFRDIVFFMKFNFY